MKTVCSSFFVEMKDKKCLEMEIALLFVPLQNSQLMSKATLSYIDLAFHCCIWELKNFFEYPSCVSVFQRLITFVGFLP